MRTLSEKVGGDGLVYAVDNDENLLQQVKTAGLPNVKVHYSRLVERIVHLPSNYFNLVIVAYRLENVLQRRAMLTEVNRLLMVNGKALIIARIRRLFRRRGFKEKELDDLLSKTPMKLLDRRKHGGMAVILLERVTPPAEK